jgi:hypothetical protein
MRLMLLVTLVLLYVTWAAIAQYVGGYSGIYNLGTGSGGTPVGNACASLGNQLDFSDVTGCNLVWAGH